MFWVSLLIIAFGVGWFLRSWKSWDHKQRGNANELDALDEMVRDYLAGRYDNVDYIRRVIADVERTHEPSATVVRELRRAREALDSGPKPRITPSA